MWMVIERFDRPLSWWLGTTVMDRAWWLAVTIAAGAGTYFLVLLVLGLRPSKLGIRPH
jgi:peptidoglycan biosynthesis protein MviN/MurJ (putative lipid II flippase)